MAVDIEKGYGNTAPYGEGSYKGEVGNTYIPDYVSRARDLLVEQFEDSDKFQAMVAAFSRQVQEVEDVLFDLRIKRYLSLAEGKQLDGIGEIVGEPRKGRNDVDYKLGINFRIFVNKSYGQMEVLSKFTSLSLAPGTTYTIEERFPAAVSLAIQALDINQLPKAIFEKVDNLAAGGVLVNGYIHDKDKTGKIMRVVEKKSDGTGAFAVPPKPDTGNVSEGLLGSYPPSEVDAGTVVEHIKY